MDRHNEADDQICDPAGDSVHQGLAAGAFRSASGMLRGASVSTTDFLSCFHGIGGARTMASHRRDCAKGRRAASCRNADAWQCGQLPLAISSLISNSLCSARNCRFREPGVLCRRRCLIPRATWQHAAPIPDSRFRLAQACRHGRCWHTSRTHLDPILESRPYIFTEVAPPSRLVTQPNRLFQAEGYGEPVGICTLQCIVRKRPSKRKQ